MYYKLDSLLMRVVKVRKREREREKSKERKKERKKDYCRLSKHAQKAIEVKAESEAAKDYFLHL